MTERQRARPQTARARISNSVSGEQCHLNHLTILRRFSWPSIAYMCTKVVERPIHFISFFSFVGLRLAAMLAFMWPIFRTTLERRSLLKQLVQSHQVF